jgi:hypothetical protein
MQKLFELILREESRTNKFINCSIDNAMGIMQNYLYTRGIQETITIPMFWDIVFRRYKSLSLDIVDLLNLGELVIKRTYY